MSASQPRTLAADFEMAREYLLEVLERTSTTIMMIWLCLVTIDKLNHSTTPLSFQKFAFLALA